MTTWTQASDPVNTNQWSGNCNNLDLFIPTIPETPIGWELNSSGTDAFVLEGFEYPIEYYNGTSTSIWAYGGVGVTNALSTDVRSTTDTGGHCLQTNVSTTVNNYLVSNYKPTGVVPAGTSRVGYFRLYFKITAWNNIGGFNRTAWLYGWTDSSGVRSAAELVWPSGVGALPKLAVGCGVPGLSGETFGTQTYSLDTWYRLELLTEQTTIGQFNTLRSFLGDSNTIIETIQYHSGGGASGGFFFMGPLAVSGGVGNSATILLDDVRIQDGYQTTPDTAQLTLFKGAGGIWCMYPKNNSAVEWTPLSGNNYTNVDEFPVLAWDDGTTYVGATGSSELTDVYGVKFYPEANFPTTATKSIKAVQTRFASATISGTTREIEALYGDVFGTLWVGNHATPTGSTYKAGGFTFLEYSDPLPCPFAPEQALGINFTASGVATSMRVTSVWGLMDIADTDS